MGLLHLPRLANTLSAALLVAMSGGHATPSDQVTTAGNDLTVTASDQGSYDRVTLTFTGSAVLPTTTADATPPYGLGSGKEMPIQGSTYYIHARNYPITLDQVVNQAGAPDLPVVRGVLAQYFEGELAVDVGLTHQTTYHVSINGHAVYLDIDH